MEKPSVKLSLVYNEKTNTYRYKLQNLLNVQEKPLIVSKIVFKDIMNYIIYSVKDHADNLIKDKTNGLISKNQTVTNLINKPTNECWKIIPNINPFAIKICYMKNDGFITEIRLSNDCGQIQELINLYVKINEE